LGVSNAEIRYINGQQGLTAAEHLAVLNGIMDIAAITIEDLQYVDETGTLFVEFRITGKTKDTGADVTQGIFIRYTFVDGKITKVVYADSFTQRS